MELSNDGLPVACWHCGAPFHRTQRLCITCGASREYHPEQFSPPALAQISRARMADAMRPAPGMTLLLDAPEPVAIEPDDRKLVGARG